MSKGNDSRTGQGREGAGRAGREGKTSDGRTSRSSVRMTAERARAIQSHAERTGRNQDFKARAMSAASKGAEDADTEREEE